MSKGIAKCYPFFILYLFFFGYYELLPYLLITSILFINYPIYTPFELG